MNITKDALDIMLYIYKEKINTGKMPQNNEIFKATNWNINRYKQALNFCINNGYISVTKLIGKDSCGDQNMTIKDLTPTATSIIEEKNSKGGNKKIYTLFNIENFNLESLIKGEFKLF